MTGRATPYRVRECVTCGRPCPPHRRWCSTSCFYAEDGYPDESSPDDGMDLMVDGDDDDE